MSKMTNKFAPEVRERAVQMVLDHERDHPSRWAAVVSIAKKIGCVPQTLHDWLKKAEVDSGKRAGVPTEVADKMKALEREVRELRQTNEILRKPDHTFAGELSDVPSEMTQLDVIAKFGEPSKTGDGIDDPILGRSGAWDRFDRGDHLLHFEYDVDAGVVSKITMMRHDMAP